MLEKKNRPNYYLLLELSYDPPEMDLQTIEDAITVKVRYWNKQANHPRKGAQFVELRQLIPDIKKVMLDDALRLQEAKNAKLTQQQAQIDQQQQLNEEVMGAILTLHAMNKLTKSNVQEVASRFQLSVNDVLAVIPEHITVQDDPERYQVDADELLDTIKMNRISDLLNQLNIEPSVGMFATIYDYFEIAEHADTKMIYDLATTTSQQLLRKTKSAQVDFQKDLCGEVKTIFKSEADRKKYDYTLQHKRFDDLKETIDLIGQMDVIDLNSFNVFLEQASKKGLMQEQATNLIKAYCQTKGYKLYLEGNTSQVNNQKQVQCLRCHQINDESTNNCTGCGTALKQVCISCQHEAKMDAKNCSHCGMNFAEMLQYNELVAKAKKYSTQQQLQEAKRMLLKAQSILDSQEIVYQLEVVNQMLTRYVQHKQHAQQLMAQYKFYEAAEQVKKAKELNVDEPELQQLQQTVDTVMLQLNQLYQQVIVLPKEAQLPILEQAQKICADCPWVPTLSDQIPPLYVTNLTAKLTGAQITISWTAQDTRRQITYKVYRTQSNEVNPTEGELICETSSTHYVDQTALPNVHYYYSVVAFRQGIPAAKYTQSNAIKRFEEVGNFEAIVREDGFEFKWLLVGGDEIALVKKLGASPTTIQDGELVASGPLEHFVDQQVSYGQTYGYTIFTIKNEGAQQTISNGIPTTLSLLQQKPNVGEFVVMVRNDGLQIESPQNLQETIYVYASDRTLPWVSQDVISQAVLDEQIAEKKKQVNYGELYAQATPTKITLALHQTVCMLRRLNEDLYQVVEMIVLHKDLLANAVLENVQQLKVSVQQNALVCQWAWNEEDEVVIQLGARAFEGKRYIVTKDEFMQHQRYELHVTDFENQFLTFYARQKQAVGSVQASGVVYQLTNEKRAVKYRLEKPGLFKLFSSKEAYLIIELQANETFVPAMAIYGKEDALPLSMQGSKLVCAFDAFDTMGVLPENVERISAQQVKIKILKEQHPGKNYYLRAFFQHTSDIEQFSLDPQGKLIT